MAGKKYSSAENRAWKRGFFAGLFHSKDKKKNVKRKTFSARATYPKKKQWYSFLAFNDNGDIYNVDAYDSSRSNALKQAREKLKRDPEVPSWGVTITADNGDKNAYFRTVTIDENVKGGVSDNWKRHYREYDDAIRQKYGKDLSKPLPKR